MTDIAMLQALRLLQTTPPAAIVDNAAFATAEINTVFEGKKASAALIIVSIGATDIPATVFKLQESDTSGSGFTDVTGADFSVSPLTLPSDTSDNSLIGIYVDLTKRKQYLDLSWTAGNGTAGTFGTVITVLAGLDAAPNTATRRGLAQQAIV